jgi:hypothetical protein
VVGSIKNSFVADSCYCVALLVYFSRVHIFVSDPPADVARAEMSTMSSLTPLLRSPLSVAR